MSFESGLSGLTASAQNLDVIGNNIANSGTAGYKASRAEFADVYANTLGSAGVGQTGTGTHVAAIQRMFTQGSITATGNPLDLAISGNGFFQVQENGNTYYTRSGQFHQDASGNVVTSSNQLLMGYGVDSSGTVSGTPGPLKFSSAPLSPASTTSVDTSVNLSSTSRTITAAFDPTDASTYNNSSSTTIYDTQGQSHTLSLYYRFGAGAAPTDPGSWNVYATVDGTQVDLGGGANTIGGATPSVPTTPAIALAFAADGSLDATTPTTPAEPSVDLTFAGTSATATIALHLAGSTQWGSAFSVKTVAVDGYAPGQLSSFNVGADGIVTGTYSNGQTRALGQVVLASFANPAGLRALGGNTLAMTAESGAARVGAPGSGDLGSLESGSIEQSNVDLTSELVNLISAQRTYQANAQSIKAQDTVMQTLVNL